MNATQFLDYLESKGLLTEKVLTTLRRQVEKKSSITPDRIVKALVQNGHLTQAQSTTIVDEARDTLKKPSESDDLLGLAPDPDEEPKKKAPAPKPAPKPQQKESSPKKTQPRKQSQTKKKSPAKKPAPVEAVLDEGDLIEDEPEIIEDLVEVEAPAALDPLAPGELMGEIVDESALVEATPADTGNVLTEEISSKGALPPGFQKKEKP